VQQQKKLLKHQPNKPQAHQASQNSVLLPHKQMLELLEAHQTHSLESQNLLHHLERDRPFSKIVGIL